jgi:hypothetical protein
MASLTELNLGDTAVSDVGLETLASLKSLHVLYLGATPATEAGIARLSRALPRLHDPSPVRSSADQTNFTTLIPGSRKLPMRWRVSGTSSSRTWRRTSRPGLSRPATMRSSSGG